MSPLGSTSLGRVPDADAPDLRQLLAAAVAAVGGSERAGQVQMAEAVQTALGTGEHLLVQAGTGTGKSLAYLVPALSRAVSEGEPVVVATATIALQRQLVERDLPLVVSALEPLVGRRPTYAILKGRRNYLCRQRLNDGVPDDEGDVLFDAAPTSALGREVARVRVWAEETRTGDRDELVPGVGERAWSQLSVSSRECMGAQRCPYGQECFAELARADAGRADLVVTNHALLAIDALEGIPLLPEHGAVVVDEGHELVDRVTQTATAELSAALVERAGRRAARHGEGADGLVLAAADLGAVLTATPAARLDPLPSAVGSALGAVRDAARAALSLLGSAAGGGAGEEPEGLAARRQSRAAVEQVLQTANRLLAGSAGDVAWLAFEERRGAVLRVAPLDVAVLLRGALFAERTVVVTSATLELGGSFDVAAGMLGLAGEQGLPWTGVDVGSPFDHARQGILYVARHLPEPGRDGLTEPVLGELVALVRAAGGRTLGLFSSHRAAVAAAAELRDQLDLPVLLQGEDRTAALVSAFAADPATCLLGTLSLWQGVDVPGPSCQLVVIDRLPFPRPDDPVRSARQRAVDDAGGNGFMAVAAAHAALLLAQGAGRLIRTPSDRGVVAVLDPRMATRRYGSFLRRSMPPFWYTEDPALVRRSLTAIDGAARSVPAPV